MAQLHGLAPVSSSAGCEQDWSKIPSEMRDMNKWVAFKLEWNAARNKFDKMPINARTGAMASVSNPSTWSSFDDVVESGAPYIGFAFTQDDPFVVIDLDNKDSGDADKDARQIKHHAAIVHAAAPEGEGIFGGSYTETSISGTGVHIIVRAQLDAGRRQDEVGIEVYPSDRFVILTGGVWPNREEIQEGQALIDYLVSQMPENVKAGELESTPSDTDDATLWQKMVDAENGSKFLELWNGNWEQFEELQGDRSRADMSLLTFLDFHSKDVDQCVRLFKMSKLYRPEKGRQTGDGTDYIMFTLRGARARNERDNPPVSNLAEIQQSVDNIMAANAAAKAKPVEADSGQGLDYPPGFAGALARDMMTAVPRPAKEIMVTSALGLLASICARQFHYSATGLNIYLALVAQTGTGKEGITQSMRWVRRAVREVVPGIDEFQSVSEIPSRQGLMRHLSEYPCSLAMIGEFGLRLKTWSDPRNEIGSQIRASLLEVYSKSGPTGGMDKVSYSKSENNIESMDSPALSVIGETTPETIYEVLTPEIVDDGFLPRFDIIEYKGKRPKPNDNMAAKPSPEVLEHMCNIVASVLTRKANDQMVEVGHTSEANAALIGFRDECDDRIDAANEAGNRPLAQLWNRGHLKALRIAALLAVADNPTTPRIEKVHADWAIGLVNSTTETLMSKFDTGQIGSVYGKRERMFMAAVHEWFELVNSIEVADKSDATYAHLVGSMGCPPNVVESRKLVASNFIRRRLKGKKEFLEDNGRKVDPKATIAATLDVLVEDGLLEVVGKAEAEKMGIALHGRTKAYAPGPSYRYV